MTRITLSAFLVVPGLLALGSVLLPAQEPKEPKYPHVNLATTYEIDPKWPQKPAELQWAAAGQRHWLS